MSLCLLELLVHIVDALVYDVADRDERIHEDYLDEICEQGIIPLTIEIMDDLFSTWTTMASSTKPQGPGPQLARWLLVACHRIVQFWGLVFRSELEYSIVAESLGNGGEYVPAGAKSAVEHGIVSTLREWSLRLYATNENPRGWLR